MFALRNLISFFCIQLIIVLVTSWRSPFPATTFFNVSDDEIDTVSKFLCQVNEKEKKSCSCDTELVKENWCIDILWKDGVHHDLEQYFEILEEFLTDHYAYDDFSTCQPIISVPDTQASQHILMTSLYRGEYGDGSDIKHCNRSVYPLYDPSFNEIYVHDMYVNKDCARKWGEDVENLKYVDVKADCSSYVNVTENEVFDMDQVSSNECIYYIFDENIVENYDEYFECPSERSHCDVSNKNFALCKAYYAPTRGYKNYHCYLCDNDNVHPQKAFTPLDKYNVYSDRRKYGKHENLMEFSLMTRVDKNEYTVKNIRKRFPIRSFLRLINADHLYTNDSSITILDELCSTINFRTCCDCHPSCIKFRSCCVDFLWNEKKSIPLDKYLKIFYEKTQKYKIHQCQRLIPSAKESFWYEMVSDCMNGSDPQVTKKCITLSDELKTFLPVVGKDLYLYRNMYCAQCNFQFSYSHVNIYYSCNGTQISKDCKFRIQDTHENNKAIRRCIDPSCLQSNCMYENSSLSIFKNIHCSACAVNKYDRKCTLDRISAGRVLRWYLPHTISFSDKAEIKSVSDDYLYEEINKPEFLVCDRNNIFSIFALYNEEKEKYTCFSSKIRLKYPDNPDFDNCFLQRDDIHIFVFIYNNNTIAPSFENDIVSLLATLFNITKPNQTLYYNDKEISILRTNIPINSNRLSLILSNIFHIQSNLARNNASISLLPTKNPFINKANMFDFPPSFPSDKICLTQEILDGPNLLLTKLCGIYQDNKTVIDATDISMNLFIDGYNLKRNLATCKQFYLTDDCTLEQSKKRNAFLYNGMARQLIDFDKTQNYRMKSLFSLKDGDIAVCKESLASKYPWIFTVMEVEMYISFVGSSISIIFYILTVGSIYLLLHLGNYHRKLNFVLVGSLILGDGMFLFTGMLELFDLHNTFVLCKIVGILMHFGILMAIIWNMVIAYDIMVTYTRTQINLDSSIPKYLFIALSSTTFIIISALLLDHFKIVSIGYGENGVCAPYKLYGRVYFYIIPSIISFIGSFIFITKVFCLTSSKNERWKALKDSGKQDLNVAWIALKITLLLGISEGIGFIQVIGLKFSGEVSKANATFGLIYTIFRSLRGLFIALVYICKRENILLFKHGHLRNESTKEIEMNDRSSENIRKEERGTQKSYVE